MVGLAIGRDWRNSTTSCLQKPTSADTNTAQARGQAAVAPGQSTSEVFGGIDAARRLLTVARFVPGKGVKPAEKMAAETLLRRVAAPITAGGRVHCVTEAGPTGFALGRRLRPPGVG